MVDGRATFQRALSVASMRNTFTAIAAAVLAVCSPAAEAKGFHVFGGHRQPASRAAASTHPVTPQPAPYHWTQGAAPKAHRDMVAAFNRVGLKPGEYVWASSVPEGNTRIVVDLLTQMTYVYRGDKLLGASTMSSAKTGHITPYGFWTILDKRPFYRSKKYDNAPMPWMERIDNYGIAFHGGVNPGYPASHGCMRLPMKFAEKLYGVTKIGTKVVIEG
jgi:lipoprotein-anchoring transpeptidase ErfK/SrfK